MIIVGSVRDPDCSPPSERLTLVIVETSPGEKIIIHHGHDVVA